MLPRVSSVQSYVVVVTAGTAIPQRESRLGVIISATAAADITFGAATVPSLSLAAGDTFEVPFGFVGPVTASAPVTFTEFV